MIDHLCLEWKNLGSLLVPVIIHPPQTQNQKLTKANNLDLWIDGKEFSLQHMPQPTTYKVHKKKGSYRTEFFRAQETQLNVLLVNMKWIEIKI